MNRLLNHVVIAVVVTSCASAGRGSGGDTITLTRSGGLAGIGQTVWIWNNHDVFNSEFRRSDQKMPLPVRLSQTELRSTFRILSSLVQVVPSIPVDTGSVRHLCGDANSTRVELSRGTTRTFVQEECPHRTSSSDAYWGRVNALFVVLSEAARR